jgi:adenosine deaminase CECR1
MTKFQSSFFKIYRRQLAWLCLLVVGLLPRILSARTFSQQFERIKQVAPREQLYRLLYAMPKGGDIHQHFNLANFAESWFLLATDPKITRNNIFYTRARPRDCPNLTALTPRFTTIQKSAYDALPPCQKDEYVALSALTAEERALFISGLKLDREDEGRQEFFDAIGSRIGDMGRDPNLAAAALVDNMRRFAAEGLRYMEVFVVGPRFIDIYGQPIPVERGVQILRERLVSPDALATGLTVRFLATVVRHHPDAEIEIERAYELVSKHRDLFVGVNLAGREEDGRGHALRFIDVFRRMRTRYSAIPLSLHAGESEAPGTQVRDTLLLGANRIGHGANLLSDTGTLLLMRGNHYLIETSLLSNQLLKYVPDIKVHPFPEFLRIGIPVCLNTDDRGAWDSNMTDEFFAAVTNFNLSWEEILTIGRNSLVFSFAEPPVRERLLREYDAAVKRFELQFIGDDWAEKLRHVSVTKSGYARRKLSITD